MDWKLFFSGLGSIFECFVIFVFCFISMFFFKNHKIDNGLKKLYFPILFVLFDTGVVILFLNYKKIMD